MDDAERSKPWLYVAVSYAGKLHPRRDQNARRDRIVQIDEMFAATCVFEGSLDEVNNEERRLHALEEEDNGVEGFTVNTIKIII
ncbi:hypothetical protein KIN20_035958 [Parelaphostrongylus tenuis]|uniref:Uncharacterized protein n=1 Tax=Parelaphostrongylus tenuis TaxID=148309 RepID=A0AAD5RBX9_PARTN|nr:hypothetical protein KIN20_035958 [Parelaphostrongylus tenuis]